MAVKWQTRRQVGDLQCHHLIDALTCPILMYNCTLNFYTNFAWSILSNSFFPQVAYIIGMADLCNFKWKSREVLYSRTMMGLEVALKRNSMVGNQIYGCTSQSNFSIQSFEICDVYQKILSLTIDKEILNTAPRPK